MSENCLDSARDNASERLAVTLKHSAAYETSKLTRNTLGSNCSPGNTSSVSEKFQQLLNMSPQAEQVREALRSQGEALRTQAEKTTDSLYNVLKSQGVPPQAARTGAYIVLASLVFLAPLISTAIALAVCWLCVSASVVVAALAVCLAVGTVMLVLVFIGLACMAGAAFAVTLMVTATVGCGIVMAVAMTATGLFGARLFARVGGRLFARVDRFISTVFSQCASETSPSDKTNVSAKTYIRMDEPNDNVTEPINHKLPLASNHEA